MIPESGNRQLGTQITPTYGPSIYLQYYVSKMTMVIYRIPATYRPRYLLQAVIYLVPICLGSQRPKNSKQNRFIGARDVMSVVY